MRQLATILLGSALCLLAASPAAAQSVRLDQYRMAETPTDGFSLSRPNGLGHLRFGVRLDVDYSLNPLVYQFRTSDPGTEIAPIVEHLLGGTLGISFGLWDRIIIFGGLHTNLVMDGVVVDGQPRADGTSLGDVYFGLRGRLFGEEDDAFAISLQVTGTAPTAQAARFQSRFAGEGSATIHPELLMEVRIESIFRIVGNAGALVRERQNFGSLEIRSELTWGLGAALTVVPDVLDITAETWGSTSLFDFGNTQVSPIEGVLGLQVHPVEGLTIGAAAGTGLQRGYGAGDFRAVLSLGYATPGEQPPEDRDGDGITDDVDECPDEPEDIDEFEDQDGCPDPDNDQDGIGDEDDECPNEPEDLDGLGDEDGCPEEDFDGDGASDETDRCPEVPGMALAPRAECTGCPTCDDGGPPPPEPPPSVPYRVLFDTGRDELGGSAEASLRDVLRFMNENPDVQVVIEGHADHRGEEPSNHALSRRRALQVARWLIQNGIGRLRIVTVGCGENYPEATGEDDEQLRPNRRVVFRVMGDGSVVRAGCAEAARQ